MTGGKHSHGFTIIEVVIVLAITGMIFYVAAISINGQQQKTEFTTSIRNIQTQIEQVANNVTNGYYSRQSPFICTSDSSTGVITVTNPTGNDITPRGTSQGCVFMGIVVQFDVSQDSNNSTLNPKQMYTYSVIGSGQQSVTNSNGEPTSYAAANATLLAPGNSILKSLYASNIVSTTLDNGLSVVSAWYCPNGSTVDATVVCGGTFSGSSVSIPSVTSYAIGFLSSVAHYTGSSSQSIGSLSSGAQQALLVPFESVTGPMPSRTAVDNIDSQLTPPGFSSGGGGSYPSADSFATQPPAAFQVCFKSGSTDKSALLTLGGGDGQKLSNTMTIKSSLDCS